MESSTQLAGHPGALVFQGATVTKQVKQPELNTYQQLDTYPGLARFVPKFFGATESTITIENLLHDCSPDHRMIDIKLGTSTLTKSAA